VRVEVVLPPQPEVIEIPAWKVGGSYRDLVAYTLRLRAAAEECKGYQEDVAEWIKAMERARDEKEADSK